MSARTSNILALLISITAVLAAAWVAVNTYDGLPHIEDELAYLWQAEVMADGEITLSSPVEPYSHLVPFVIDYQGSRFGKYSPAWPAMLSLGVRLGIPLFTNALLAGVLTWLSYRLGQRLAGSGVGLLTALLIASSPMTLMLAGSFMSHTFSLLLALAFMLAWLELFLPATGGASPTPSWLLIVVCGMALGVLALTRPMTAVGVAFPFGLHGLWLLLRSREDRAGVIGIGLIVVLLALLLPVWNAALTGEVGVNPYTLWWEYDQIGFGPGVGRVDGGHTLEIGLRNTRYSLKAGVNDIFGWQKYSLLLLPVGLWYLRKKRAVWLLLGMVLSLVAVHLAYWIGSWLYGPRYYYEALPVMAVLTAAGVAGLGGWLAPTWKRWLSFRHITMVAIPAALMAAAWLGYMPGRLQEIGAINDIKRADQELFLSTGVREGLVFVHTINRWWDYGKLVTLTAPFSDGDLVLVLFRSDTANARVRAAFPELPVYHYYMADPGRIIPGY